MKRDSSSRFAERVARKGNPVRDAEFSIDVERPRRGSDARGAGGPGDGHSSALIGNVRFDADVMVATMNEVSRPCWDGWERVTVPTLVVYAEKRMFTAEEKSEFVDRGREARRVDLAGAPHDAHLNAFKSWIITLRTFLRT